jgi:pectinesterase
MLLTLLLAVSAAQATTRFVSAQGAGQYTTLNAAATASASGDTILVGPGTYSTGQINEASKRLTWIGAGWDQTIINLNNQLWYINTGPGANRTSIEGMRINNPGNYIFYVVNNADSITIRRCWLTSGYDQVRVASQGGRGVSVEDCILAMSSSTGSEHISLPDGNYPTVVRGCVFADIQAGNTNSAFIGGASSGTLEVYNCVFLNERLLFSLNSAGGAVIGVNNLFYDWGASPSFGTYNAGSVFDYNASSGPATLGTDTLHISVNPFVNYNTAVDFDPTASNLHLDPTNGAAFVNTGHPSLLDFTDGSRSDFGAYGGPKPLVDNGVANYPWAINVTSTPNLVGAGTPINASATGRVGPAY